jgi:tRNA-specific 2-thiouridylase
MSKVVIAMSGGVDSSVAAALLKQQGNDVTGMMLRLWSEEGKEDSNRCCTPDAMGLARRVAAILDIPFYVVDAKNLFHTTVVQAFLNGYARGGTPNPCLVCNRTIRWEFLFEHAMALDAEYMATGHYVRTTRDENDQIHLLRGVDHAKDQSYVLHVLSQDKLAHSLFPIGMFPKYEVREMAKKFGLPSATRSDSQDLCFLAGDDYRAFIRRNAPEIAKPGPILNRSGQKLGEHQGLVYYTIGQRKGLGIQSEVPQYVLTKQIESNALIVGTANELGTTTLHIPSIQWISGHQPEQIPEFVQVKTRYTAREALANVKILPDAAVEVSFNEPQRDITPGQAAVLYDGEEVLGGGLIG